MMKTEEEEEGIREKGVPSKVAEVVLEEEHLMAEEAVLEEEQLVVEEVL
jgi:hypothetical protein